jgi:hypothetical protein
MQFITRQNQAKQTGRTGIAAFICEVLSTRLASIFGLTSCKNQKKI